MSQVESPSAKSLARSMKNAVHGVLNRWRYHVLLNQQVFPKPPRAILVVCKEHCRSPLAEAYLKHEMEKNGLPVTVSSAGLETSFGKPVQAL